MEPAKKVEEGMEVEQSDIEKIVLTLDKMDKFRGGSSTNQEKNEYLALTSLLSGLLESNTDERVQQKLSFLKEARDSHPALYGFDYLDEEFWQEAQPEISRMSDELTIQLLGDDFRGFEDKQHIMNAIKYLGSEELPKKKQLAIYDIILPLIGQSRPTIQNSNPITSRFLNEIFKPSVLFENQRDHPVMQVQNKKELDALVHGVQYTIYTQTPISVIMPSLLCTHFDIETKERLTHPSRKQPPQKIRETPRMKALGYAIMGNLPEKVQTHFEKKWGKDVYDAAKASSYSSITNYLLSGLQLGGAAVLSVVYNGFQNTPEGTPSIFAVSLACSGVSFFLTELCRGLYASDRDYLNSSSGSVMNITNYKKPMGSILGFIPGLVINAYIQRKARRISDQLYSEDQEEGKPKYHDLVLADMSIAPNRNCYERKRRPERVKLPNYHSKLEIQGRKKVSDKAEQNLVWSSPHNHHTQAEQFLEEIRKTRFKGNELMLRNTDCAVIYNWSTENKYEKVSALICAPYERYAVTYINRRKEHPNFEQISEVLTKESSFEEKAGKLIELLKPAHLHLTHFSKGEKVGDYQGSYDQKQGDIAWQK